MTLPPPCRRFLRLVGQGCQGKAAVGEAHSLGIILQHLISSFYDLPLVFGVCRLADGIYPVVDDQLMHLSHELTVTSVFHRVNVGVWWRKLFEEYLILCLLECAGRLHGITASRATSLQYGGATRLHSRNVDNYGPNSIRTGLWTSALCDSSSDCEQAS